MTPQLTYAQAKIAKEKSGKVPKRSSALTTTVKSGLRNYLYRNLRYSRRSSMGHQEDNFDPAQK